MRPVIFLKPGELYVATEAVEIRTLLGSCVAVCIHDKGSGHGAMCHGLLPWHSPESKRTNFEFVDYSIDYMVNRLLGLGVTKKAMTVKIFGGAVLMTSTPDYARVSIGPKNVEAARTCLCQHGLRVQSEQVGGRRGYKIYFFTDSGVVLMKRLSRPVQTMELTNG